jgi:hypothetical protein
VSLVSAATMSIEKVNEVVAAFGHEHRRAVNSERRAALTSSLFDVPRRSSLANMIFYEQGPELLRLLQEHAAPEWLGEAMKRPGSRPYSLSLWVVMGMYMSGRQQTYLNLGVKPGESVEEQRPEDLRTVVEFYSRVGHAYRNDDQLFPTPEVPTQPILDEKHLAQSLALAAPPTPDRLAAIKRTGASLNLYNFLQHGEQRDGIFGHGPYAGPAGSVVWFEEFNDLRNEFLPWAQLDCEPIPVGNVVFVHAADGVELEPNMFGALRVHPFDYEDSLRLIGAFTYAEDEARSLDDCELAAIAAIAERRHVLFFEQAVGWSDEYRIAYGAPLFANHVVPFFDLAGVPDGRRIVMDTFERGTGAAMAGLSPDADVPSFWTHLASDPSEPLYSPVR